jgi:transcriptional regulator GlxA family with amidase domain
MRVAIVTFDGFNELDSIIAAHIINRVDLPGWKAEITAPDETVTSMNGVAFSAQQSLEFTEQADAVVIGSGRRTRQVIGDCDLMARLRVDPNRQLVAGQCSGVLVLAKLGLLAGGPVCTDRKTQPWVEAAGYRVLDRPFHAHGSVATAGGCLSAHYLATWLIWSRAGREVALDALRYVLPHSEESDYVQRVVHHVEPFVEAQSSSPMAQPNYRLQRSARTRS